MNIPSGSVPLLICFLAARDNAGETAGVSVQAAAQELRTLHYEPGLPSISALSSVIPERLPGAANADDAPSIRPPILQEMSGESEASGVDEVIFPLATAGRLTFPLFRSYVGGEKNRNVVFSSKQKCELITAG